MAQRAGEGGQHDFEQEMMHGRPCDARRCKTAKDVMQTDLIRWVAAELHDESAAAPAGHRDELGRGGRLRAGGGAERPVQRVAHALRVARVVRDFLAASWRAPIGTGTGERTANKRQLT